MRTLIFVALIFFSFAPSAFAAGATGSWDTDPATGGIQTSPTNPGNQVQTSPTNPRGTNITLIDPLKGGGNLQSFLLNILDIVIRVGSIFVVLMMVLVGYKFVAAQGVPGKIEEARNMLLWTVIGALILLGSKAIALGIEATVRALSGGS
ncbi:MAG: hypothetical protein Q8L30_01490 [bacterium]|nr:hypothetical protein [bacterium]